MCTIKGNIYYRNNCRDINWHLMLNIRIDFSSS